MDPGLSRGNAPIYECLPLIKRDNPVNFPLLPPCPPGLATPPADSLHIAPSARVRLQWNPCSAAHPSVSRSLWPPLASSPVPSPSALRMTTLATTAGTRSRRPPRTFRSPFCAITTASRSRTRTSSFIPSRGDLPVPPAGRAPCRGRSCGSPARRNTKRPAPAAHRAGPRARHGLPLHQLLSCDCSFPQTGMITAAALTLPHLRPSVTRVSGQHEAPPAYGGCDLWLRSQGHDLQLPYQCPLRSLAAARDIAAALMSGPGVPRPRVRPGGGAARRARSKGARHDVARSQRARSEHGCPVTI